MREPRLREGHSTDPIWARIEEMCRGQSPSRPDALLRARVLSRIEQARPRALFLRPIPAALAVVFFAATASALFRPAQRWLSPSAPSSNRAAPSPERAAPNTAAASQDRGGSRPPLLPGRTVSAPPPERVSSPAIRHRERASRERAPPADAPAVEGRVLALRADEQTRLERREEKSSRPSVRALDPEESLIVHSAVRALRVERRVGRARSLLGDYLRRFPRGVLVEDAIALSIEAATADRDDGAARKWAERYLGEFPDGRFRATAYRALSADSLKGDPISHP